MRVGGIYECNFGSYKSLVSGEEVTHSRDDADEENLNYRIPNEMIKRRPVVVIKKHRGLCMVVPVSATREKPHKNPRKDQVEQGICVPLSAWIPQTRFYTGKDCWGVCYAAQTIDIGRLRDIYDKNTGTFVNAMVSDEMLLKLRFGIVKAVGLESLVPSTEEERINSALGF